jgi:hypothetical protein
MEKATMKDKKQNLTRRLFGLAVLILLAGMLTSALLFKQSGISRYTSLIADAYREAQHHLTVPGAKEVKLTRTGAYGIYYEHSLVAAAVDPRTEIPPAIECSLTSQSTGAKIAAVLDYVETNRYWPKEHGGTGVLMMSITVDQPDAYTFACNYQDGSTEPEIVVALGPNYFWEFIRVAWKISFPVLGGISILCGSFLLALLLSAGVVLRALHIAQARDSR